MLSIRLLAAVVLCALTACARPAQRPQPAAPASIPNLSAVKQDIRNYRSSGRWEADIRQAADECLAFAEGTRGTVARPAVVFDIDETLLSNWQYEVDNDFARSIPLFRTWALRAACTPIDPVKRFYVTMRDEGVACFVITGRRASLRAATEENLRRVGLDGWQGIAFQPAGYESPSIVPFKSGERAKIEQQGYTIVANIGDQQSDLEGGHALHVCKVPNPMYLIP